jgi:proline iminopeptidase
MKFLMVLVWLRRREAFQDRKYIIECKKQRFIDIIYEYEAWHREACAKRKVEMALLWRTRINLQTMPRSFQFLLTAIILFLNASCSNVAEKELPELASNAVVSAYAMEFTPEQQKEREAKWAEPGVRRVELSNGYNVFTQTFGESADVCILALHGGPAATHEYLLSLAYDLPAQHGFEVVMYDQLGSFFSDQPTEDIWNIDRWVEEVEEVRQALGYDASNFYLLGNSWGGILAMEYALRYQENLNGLIVCNMVSSIPEYAAYNQNVLRPQMRPSLLDSLNAFEEAGDLQNETYLELIQSEFYNKHICRLDVWPEEVETSFAKLNYPLYDLMQGPSEFKVGGRLIDWDITDRLKEISAPTLMVGATHDTMDPEAMKRQSEWVQNGQSLTCEKGAHLCMWDDREVFMSGVASFIAGVER